MQVYATGMCAYSANTGTNFSSHVSGSQFSTGRVRSIAVRPQRYLAKVYSAGSYVRMDVLMLCNRASVECWKNIAPEYFAFPTLSDLKLESPRGER